MTGLKLVKMVEGVLVGRKMEWLVFCPIFQPEADHGWYDLTAWSKKKRTSIRVHADWLDNPDQMSREVVRQLADAA